MHALLIPVFLLAFTVFWFLIIALLARLGGWDNLASQYSASSTPASRIHSFQSGRFGIVNYSNCLGISCGASGLYLSVLLPFRFHHPPLQIPWADIRITDSQAGLFGTTARLEIGDVAVSIPARFLASQDFDSSG